MAKKYFNGVKPCSFVIGGAAPRPISSWLQSCKEFFEPFFIEDKDIGGRHYQKFLYAHYWWEVDLIKASPFEDTKIMRDVINAELAAVPVFIIPHSEYDTRRFEVFTQKDKIGGYRALPGAELAEGMEGISRTFKTVFPVYTWDLLDPNEADKNLQPTGIDIDNLV